MNFIAPPATLPAAMKSPARSCPPAPAGDTYIAVLNRLLEIGDKLKIQSIAIEHARNCAAKRDWTGVQLGLAMLCESAKEARRIAAETNAKIAPDLDSATLAYGEGQ